MRRLITVALIIQSAAQQCTQLSIPELPQRPTLPVRPTSPPERPTRPGLPLPICEPPSPPPSPPSTPLAQAVRFNQPWANMAAANSNCIGRSMRLCTFEELCPGGLGSTPVMGQSASDQYAVYDCAASVGGCPAGCTQYDVIQIGTYTGYGGASPPYTCRSYQAPNSAGGLNDGNYPGCGSSGWWANTLRQWAWTSETVCC